MTENICVTCLWVVLLSHCMIGIISLEMTTDQVLEDIFSVYNKDRAPTTSDNKPTVVNFNVYIKSIYDVSEYSSSFKVRYYLNLFWHDSRVTFTPFIENNVTVERIKLPNDYVMEKGMYLQLLEVNANIVLPSVCSHVDEYYPIIHCLRIQDSNISTCKSTPAMAGTPVHPRHPRHHCIQMRPKPAWLHEMYINRNTPGSSSFLAHLRNLPNFFWASSRLTSFRLLLRP